MCLYGIEYLLVLELSVLEGVLVFVHVVSGLSEVSVLWSGVPVLLQLWAAAPRHNQYIPKGPQKKRKKERKKVHGTFHINTLNVHKISPSGLNKPELLLKEKFTLKTLNNSGAMLYSTLFL